MIEWRKNLLMPITYLITGANRGIGLEMSRNVLLAGDRLMALCRHLDQAIELQTLIASSNGRGEVFQADVCDEKQLQDIANRTEGAVDVVVCNAGVMSARGGIHDAENNAASISNVLMTNIAGPFFTARAFLKQLKRSQDPKICIVSSLMGSQQHQGASAYFYRASKAGANNLMVTLTHELKAEGIAVASFHPGWVKTDMGGSHADISPTESATGLLTQFRALTLADSGSFLNYDGQLLPL